MGRTTIRVRAWGAIAALTALLGVSAAFADARPNILLLVAEDLSARVGAFGDAVAHTPNIDALAARGVRYPNTFTAAGVCAPSRAALISGMHQESIGAQHMRTSSSPVATYMAVPPPEMKAFPELLRAAGYYTFTDRKLDYQFSGIFAGTGPFTIWDAEGEGADWSGRAPDQPFFGMINFLVTHESALFEPWTELFAGNWQYAAMAGMQAWERFDLFRASSPDAVQVPPYYPDVPEVRRSIARHYDNIAAMDRQVGAWLERLAEAGLADNTIVIWTTDHGDAFPRAKRELFDSGIRVPMVVAWPDGRGAGTARDRLVSFVDFAPTLLRLAGTGTPAFLQGSDFLVGEPRQYIYAARDRIDEQRDRVRAVRDHRYKYIRYWQAGTPGAVHLNFRDHQPIMQALWEAVEDGSADATVRAWFEPRPAEALYDLHDDPHETVNLANEPAHAETLARLRAALDARPHADLSEEDEALMAERFWPGQMQPTTQSVAFEPTSAGLELRSATPGASIGYRLGAGPWRLYTGPIEVGAVAVQAKAVRYGWQESELTQYDAIKHDN